MVTATAPSTDSNKPSPAAPGFWLFNAPVDLSVFLGSAVVSLLALWVGHLAGVLYQETPEWAWVPFILLIDVAHVYATGFRVYFDRQELRRHPLLYWGTPLFCLVTGIALYQAGGSVLFWRVLAYFAVFHFVRQQYGWLKLYRAKRRETIAWEKHVDVVAIYAATIYPLIYWHGHLPRNYTWFTPQDFGALPRLIADVATPFYWSIMGAYVAKSIRCWLQGRGNPGKDIVVVTTAVCWYVGIVTFNSDYAFTVTNVVIHGVPYIALVYFYLARKRDGTDKPSRGNLWSRLVLVMSTIWFLAYLEELIWHRAIYHERGWLFGGELEWGDWDWWLIPALAVPQLTHYILDGFIWRRKGNPELKII